jgi:hypothetical protein
MCLLLAVTSLLHHHVPDGMGRYGSLMASISRSYQSLMVCRDTKQHQASCCTALKEFFRSHIQRAPLDKPW